MLLAVVVAEAGADNVALVEDVVIVSDKPLDEGATGPTGRFHCRSFVTLYH